MLFGLQDPALDGLERPDCMDNEEPFVAANTQCPPKKRGRKPKCEKEVPGQVVAEALPPVYYRGSLEYVMQQRGFPLQASAASLGFSTEGLSDNQIAQRHLGEVSEKKGGTRKRKVPALVQESNEEVLEEKRPARGRSAAREGLPSSSHQEMVLSSSQKLRKRRSRRSLLIADREVKAAAKRVRSRGSTAEAEIEEKQPKKARTRGYEVEHEVKPQPKRVRSRAVVEVQSEAKPLPKKVRSRGSVVEPVVPSVAEPVARRRLRRARSQPEVQSPAPTGKRSKRSKASAEHERNPQQTVRSPAIAPEGKKERSAEVKARQSRKSCAYKKARGEAVAAGKTWEEAVADAKAATLSKTCIHVLTMPEAYAACA